MQGNLDRVFHCPVAGREVRVLEIHDTCQPTRSCCLSHRVLMSHCEEEEGCRRRVPAVSCPLWEGEGSLPGPGGGDDG